MRRVTDVMDFTSDAPGADDDGSGVAVVLEMVRILSTARSPEATATVMRAYLEHGLFNRPQPVRLYSLINAFRHDQPQAGRLREFHQWNCEAVTTVKRWGMQRIAVEKEVLTVNWFDEVSVLRRRMKRTRCWSAPACSRKSTPASPPRCSSGAYASATRAPRA